MEIILAKTAGFCFGVQNAINKALSAKGKIVTLGEIIHNELVVNNLMDKGIYPINNLDEYEDGRVVIRSHGVGEQVYKQMQERNIEYIDATCPFVEKIHKLVNSAYNQGKQVIITGEAAHAEVIGINGWCDNSGIVISDEKEARELDFISKECVLVSQTTFSAEKFKNIEKIIKENMSRHNIGLSPYACLDEEALRFEKIEEDLEILNESEELEESDDTLEDEIEDEILEGDEA